MARTCLNVGAWQTRSVANGPGERFVLWLQGCPRRCPGCLSPEFQPFERRRVIPVEDMARRILSVPGIEGVTYTGGEPIVQARGLAELGERLQEAGLTVVCYTGETIEALQARDRPWITRMLASVDILIDGPYLQEEAANPLWRGSSNQRVHFLSPAYRHPVAQVASRPAQVELALEGDRFVTTGTWPRGFLERLREVLRG